MLLGKRARHPMKRTTSMKEFSYDDLSVLHPPPPPSPSDQLYPAADRGRAHRNQSVDRRVVMAMVSPRTMHRRNSADFALHSSSSSATASTTFLTTCSLCHRRLAPGRDIYMYRGDSAYCSLECRQQQMAQDERREKENNSEKHTSPLVIKQPSSSIPTPHSHPHAHSSPAGSHVSSATGETIAAL